MVDPIKDCAEINLHDPCLLPTIQCTLQCMGHAQKCITGTQTFPISKLGGWKYTTAFHKSSKWTQHQALKHLRQYWCYGNWSVIGNRGGRWTFRNWGDICLSRDPTNRDKFLNEHKSSQRIIWILWLEYHNMNYDPICVGHNWLNFFFIYVFINLGNRGLNIK